MTIDQTSTPIRADAARNRERLIEAAAASFAESGTGVALETIAKRTGVGIGTLYRHFPSRDALIEAVYRREIQVLTDTVGAALAEHAGDEALRTWMAQFLSYVTAKRGMGDAIKTIVAAAPDLRGTVFGMLHGSLDQLVAAGIADGTIRADARSEDVLQAMTVVFSLPNEDGWREQAQRLLDLLLDGLRAR
jgi:AcrR family transcriptional regulator